MNTAPRPIHALIAIWSVQPALAAPTIGDCDAGDAPSAYTSTECGAGYCAFASGTLTCTTHTNDCGGDELMYAVHDYNSRGDHHFAAWGTCEIDGVSQKWCCTIDDDSSSAPEIDAFKLEGDEGEDALSFEHTVTNDNMEPHMTGDLLGIIEGGDGGDYITGSDYVGGDYRDTLYGEDGDDQIQGRKDADLMYGGPGDDTLHGHAGNDRMDGGEGVDNLYGNDGNDVICDTSEDTNGCTANYFEGGEGGDLVWLEHTVTCDAAGDWAAGSDAGNGTDSCGDASVGSWGATPWTGCDLDTLSKPTACP